VDNQRGNLRASQPVNRQADNQVNRGKVIARRVVDNLQVNRLGSLRDNRQGNRQDSPLGSQQGGNLDNPDKVIARRVVDNRQGNRPGSLRVNLPDSPLDSQPGDNRGNMVDNRGTLDSNREAASHSAVSPEMAATGEIVSGTIVQLRRQCKFKFTPELQRLSAAQVLSAAEAGHASQQSAQITA
jgi:hypothetical protein